MLVMLVGTVDEQDETDEQYLYVQKQSIIQADWSKVNDEMDETDDEVVRIEVEVEVDDKVE